MLLKLLLDKNKNNGDGTLFAAGSGDAAAAIDAAVDAVNAESPELFTMTDTQYDTMRQALKDGVYDAPYSASTLRRLNELNALLDELTDLVETNDISGFVARYQKANDLYASLSGKLPDALKKFYEALVRITELENMKDLCICLKKLSTATRGFGLYTITSDNGKLTLETLTRDGFGDPYNHGLRAFATNDEQGWMVIGTANPFMGTQLWRTTVNTPDPMERFTDLNPFNWAYPGIRYCVTNGLMSGTSDTTFAPDAVMTRAQIVQVLYNLAGKPAVAGTTPFTDLTSDWYQDAVLWAYRTGVVAGTSDTTFDPDAPVTREQIAVILMGYADMVQHRDHTWPPADLSAFPDGADVSDWARDAVAEAVALGILNGAEINGELWLLPQGAGDPRAGRHAPRGLLQDPRVNQTQHQTGAPERGAGFLPFFVPVVQKIFLRLGAASGILNAAIIESKRRNGMKKKLLSAALVLCLLLTLLPMAAFADGDVHRHLR